jgi:hypothetical protein
MTPRKKSEARRARRVPAELYRHVIESLPLGLKIWRLEHSGDPGSLRLLASNEAAAEATGVPLEQVMGRTMAEAFPQAVPLGIAGQFADVALSGQPRDLGELVYGDARMREGVFTVYAFPLPDRCVGVMFENVTREKLMEAARVRREALGHLSLRILEAANASATAAQAYERCLAEICTFTRCPLGHVFQRGPGEPALRSANVWFLSDGARFARFREATETLTIARGVGLPGRVWDSGKPAWLIDVAENDSFPRAGVLSEVGLKGAFGFPVNVDGELVAVLECFTEEGRVPDQELVAIMERAGGYLADVVRRAR